MQEMTGYTAEITNINNEIAYLNSQMLNRIKPLLKEMEDADMKIKKMDKKLIQGLVTK